MATSFRFHTSITDKTVAPERCHWCDLDVIPTDAVGRLTVYLIVGNKSGDEWTELDTFSGHWTCMWLLERRVSIRPTLNLRR